MKLWLRTPVDSGTSKPTCRCEEDARNRFPSKPLLVLVICAACTSDAALRSKRRSRGSSSDAWPKVNTCGKPSTQKSRGRGDGSSNVRYAFPWIAFRTAFWSSFFGRAFLVRQVRRVCVLLRRSFFRSCRDERSSFVGCCVATCRPEYFVQPLTRFLSFNWEKPKASSPRPANVPS